MTKRHHNASSVERAVENNLTKRERSPRLPQREPEAKRVEEADRPMRLVYNCAALKSRVKPMLTNLCFTCTLVGARGCPVTAKTADCCGVNIGSNQPAKLAKRN